MFHFDKKTKKNKKNSKSDAKCFVTHGKLGHLDPKQPPVKRKPFANLLGQPFVHQAELILPSEVYEIIKDELRKVETVQYSRVIFPLRALLEGDLFNEFVKKGDILLLSRGRLGVDNVYSLHSGILTLTLDRATYERSGIIGGKPYGPKGGRSSKPRWVVEINLRLPCMLHGRKGFERIVKAFEGPLAGEVEWLFCDLNAYGSGDGITLDPLAKHHPIKITASSVISRTPETRIPNLKVEEDSLPLADSDPDPPVPAYPYSFDDQATEIYEWLSLISLSSPRIDSNDQIDPFLSRYAPPAPSPLNPEPSELVKVTWDGFLPAKWVHEAFVKIMLATSSIKGESEDGKVWFSFGVRGFHGSWSRASRDVLILKLPSGEPGEYILWDVSQQ